MFLGAGEIDQRSAVTFGLEQAHIHLQPLGHAKAHFIFAASQHLLEFAIAENVFLDGFEFLGFGFRRVGQQKIEIADGFLPAAQRTRRRNRSDGFAVALDIGDELGGFVLGGGNHKAPANFLEDLDGLENVLFGFFAEAGQIAQLAFAGQLLQLIDCAALEFAPENQSLLGAERLQREHFEHGQRIFLQQLFAQAVVAGGENLADVLGHSFADAGKLFELFRIGGDDFDRFGQAGDQFGGFLITAIAADDGAVDLQQLRGLAQDARDLPILHASLRDFLDAAKLPTLFVPKAHPVGSFSGKRRSRRKGNYASIGEKLRTGGEGRKADPSMRPPSLAPNGSGGRATRRARRRRQAAPRWRRPIR